MEALGIRNRDKVPLTEMGKTTERTGFSLVEGGVVVRDLVLNLGSAY